MCVKYIRLGFFIVELMSLNIDSKYLVSIHLKYHSFDNNKFVNDSERSCLYPLLIVSKERL